MPEYVVREITVTGSFKTWSDPGRASEGLSGGSEIAITAVHPDVNLGLCWTPKEAEIVGFDLRCKIHVMLMADAQIRGIPLPASASHALVKYRDKLVQLRNGHTTVAFKDADLPSPAPPLVKDDVVEDPSEVVVS